MLKKLVLANFLLVSFAFGELVTCKRKVDTSETSTAKHYTWYFWKQSPPCPSKPGQDARVVYCNYTYGRISKVIIKTDCGNTDPQHVL